MEVVHIPEIFGVEDGDGSIKQEYSSYSDLNDDLGNLLLESKLASGHQEYEKTTVDTDNENYFHS